MDFELQEIYRAIMEVLTQKVHRIGNKIKKEAQAASMQIIDHGDYKDHYIYAWGDFHDSAGYIVTQVSHDTVVLRVGSNVKHEPYVLGGKVPSWTPIAPLISWVERKGLAWVDKDTGEPLSVETMAYMIRAAIKRRGIPARNVYREVIDKYEDWIVKELESMVVNIT